LLGAVAVSRQGVDFASLDGERVNLFFFVDFTARQARRSSPALENNFSPVARRHLLPLPEAG